MKMDNWSMKSLDESVVGWCADRYDEKIAKYVKSVTDSIGNFQSFIKNYSFFSFHGVDQRRNCRQYYFPVFGNWGEKRSDKVEIFDQGNEL